MGPVFESGRRTLYCNRPAFAISYIYVVASCQPQTNQRFSPSPLGMISTISMQSHCTVMQDQCHRMVSLTANAAGHPLPLTPRRARPSRIQSPPWPLSSSPFLSAPSSTTPEGNENSISASASIVTITPATPPKTESDSDNSPQRRSKRRKRDIRLSNPTASELSTPMPTLHTAPLTSLSLNSTWTMSNNGTIVNKNAADATPCAIASGTRASLIYAPGMPLRFSIESLKKAFNRIESPGLPSSHSDQSLRPSSSTPMSLSPSSAASTASSQASPTTPLIRKKSGQLVRPSLKSSSSYSASRSASHLGIVSPEPLFPSSKSEPGTPLTPKAVHFDENLAQVKFFLTEQKPLAVSREGSPVDTDEGETSASGAENNEVKRFFGSVSLSNKKPPTKLLMHTNLPLRSTSLLSSTANVTLESLLLAKGDKTILGSVLVRNIAFDKSVTARFSFDGWSTTSEVNARWKEGAGATRGGRTEWDRFEFSIWLGDLKLGEEKGDSRKLELAVRYRVPGRGYEVWDNNGSQNYVATFDRPRLEEERGRKAHLRKKSQPMQFSDDELNDLLKKGVTSKTTRKARSTSPTVPKLKWPTPTSFDRSARSPLSNTPCKPVGLHARTRSFPFSSSPPLSPSPVVPAWLTMFENQDPKATSPVPSATLGSPRDLGSDVFQPPSKFPTISGIDSEETVGDSGPEARKLRHHQRGGCFNFPPKQLDAGASAEPATPTPPPSSRFQSLPPLKIAQNKPSTLPSAVGANLAPQNASDSSDSSSPASSLLEKESPCSSRSSTPEEEEPDVQNIDERIIGDPELYRDFLNR